MLSDHLQLLQQAGLIQPAPGGTDPAFQFRHGLLQEAAYSTLLKQQRRDWHLTCGELLESTLPESSTRDSLAPLLAQHFSIAGLVQRALPYFIKAADAAFSRYANIEAGDYYAQALKLAGAAPYAPELAQHLHLRYGRTLELRSQFDAALRHYEDAENLARQHADRALELAALLERAKILATVNLSHDPERSRALLAQAAALAQGPDDHATQARLYWTLMLQNTMRGGDPDERLADGERSLTVARERGLREQLAYTLQDMFFAYGGLSLWQPAQRSLLEARALWRELKDLLGECEVALRLSLVAMLAGNYAESLALAEDGYQRAEAIHSDDMRALSHSFVGLIHAEHGDYDQAATVTEAARRLAATTGNVTVLAGSQAELGLAYGELGAAARGLPLALAAMSFAETQFPLLQSWAAAAVARLHLLAGDAAQAARVLSTLPSFREAHRRAGYMAPMWLNVALAEGELALAQGQFARAAALMAEAAALQGSELRFRRPDLLYLRAQAFAAQGRLAQARSDLQAARLEALALNSRRMHWRILSALADIEARTGQHSQAEHLRRQSRDIVAYIAAHTPSPVMRQSFLARPDVRAVLASEETDGWPPQPQAE